MFQKTCSFHDIKEDIGVNRKPKKRMNWDLKKKIEERQEKQRSTLMKTKTNIGI